MGNVRKEKSYRLFTFDKSERSLSRPAKNIIQVVRGHDMTQI